MNPGSTATIWPYLIEGNQSRDWSVLHHSAAWVAFATNGDCGLPKYDPSRRATMRFDTMSEVVHDPRSAQRALWEGVR